MKFILFAIASAHQEHIGNDLIGAITGPPEAVLELCQPKDNSGENIVERFLPISISSWKEQPGIEDLIRLFVPGFLVVYVSSMLSLLDFYLSISFNLALGSTD